MAGFPKLRPALWDGAVLLTVLILAGAVWLGLYSVNAADRLTAVVYMEGEAVDRVVLDTRTVTRLYTNRGITLRAEFRDGGAEVLESECPTQICVHTGRIERSGQSIICLPAGIVIRLEGGEAGAAPDTALN